MSIVIKLILFASLCHSKPKCRRSTTNDPSVPERNQTSGKYPIYGLGYNAKHSTGACSDINKVLKDFNFMKQYTNSIRTFGLYDCNQGPLLLEASKQTGMKVSLGMFINQFEEEFNKELGVLKSMVESNKDSFVNVEHIIVGSESFYRKENTLQQMADYVKKVKNYLNSQNLNIKVTCADVKDSWYPSPLTEAVDVMFVNAYPYWESIPIENAVDHLFAKINEVRARVPNKEFILGETGWPSGGQNYGSSIASVENQIKYFSQFICRANKENLKYYWFSAFDESWKEGESKMNWGMFTESFQVKPGYPDISKLQC